MQQAPAQQAVQEKPLAQQTANPQPRKKRRVQRHPQPSAPVRAPLCGPTTRPSAARAQVPAPGTGLRARLRQPKSAIPDVHESRRSRRAAKKPAALAQQPGAKPAPFQPCSSCARPPPGRSTPGPPLAVTNRGFPLSWEAQTAQQAPEFPVLPRPAATQRPAQARYFPRARWTGRPSAAARRSPPTTMRWPQTPVPAETIARAARSASRRRPVRCAGAAAPRLRARGPAGPQPPTAGPSCRAPADTARSGADRWSVLSTGPGSQKIFQL